MTCRLGMLTPSSNTVLEPYTAHLLAPLFPTVTAHFSRMPVTSISLEKGSRAQFDIDRAVTAAELLAHAKVDVITWNGTSASWLGLDHDAALCAAITAATGIPATSATLGLHALLRRLSIRRIGLVSPYTADVVARIAANFSLHDIEVVHERHLAIEDNHAFGLVDEARIGQMCRAVAAAPAEAVVILCTNMRGAALAPALEAELGIPVLDSVAFALWSALATAGADYRPLARWGRLFELTTSG